MKTKIRVSTQVEEFVKSLAPNPRRRLRLAMKGLEDGKGDVKYLEGKLIGYGRLSVANYRLIFKESTVGGARQIDGIFLERRGLVYEVFTRLLSEQLLD